MLEGLKTQEYILIFLIIQYIKFLTIPMNDLAKLRSKYLCV